MKKLMNLLMLSCRKATELVEKKQYFQLSLLERIQLYLHTRMCDACRTYEKQSHRLDEMFKSQLGSPGRLPHTSQLPTDDLKKKIIANLRNKK